MEFNKYQSTIEELDVDNLNDEIKEQFYDAINNIPFIKSLISPNRKRAKDLPRDDKNRIIVDVTQPHILEDMDYFRPTAIHYQKTGKVNNLRPNANPNSEYGKWIREEVRRCHEGYVRYSDGEWITGDMYFFLNYCPILLSRIKEGRKALRVWDFPEVWEGHYYKFHYIEQARNNGHHGAELASRSKGKSFTLASMLAKRFILGENEETTREVKCLATAYQKEYLTKDGLLNKFQSYIDFCSQNTEFPAKRLKSSLQDMSWKMGYIDLDTNTQKGTLNEVLGVSSKDNESKLRGKRGVLIAIEEFGTFPNLLGLYGTLRPSVEEGDSVFGLIYLQGTAGDNESDFASAQEIMYNPVGYNMQDNKNVYDKEGQGRPRFVYFFPGYLNRKGCYNKDGNSDVTKALVEILKNRYTVKYNSSDINAVTKTISEVPITPQEAILRTRGNLFPVTQLNERINQLDNNPAEYDDVYVGNLFLNKSGEVEFKPCSDSPIRDFPIKDNKQKGAIEIFQMPERDRNGKVYSNRYIAGIDPTDSDCADTMSLCSIFILDLYTDKIVAEYTGRQDFADDNFELMRLLLLFYNAKACYENNLKGLYAYFSRTNCVHLLCDTPEYLKDKQLIKLSGYGNKAHPYSQEVITPQGKQLWADIQKGDVLFAPNNKVVKVVDIPFDDFTDVYKVNLEDGRSIMCSENHLWQVYKLGRKHLSIFSTKDLLNSGLYSNAKQHKFFIPNSGTVEFQNQEIPIDPYTMGLLLTEGCFTGSHLSKNYIQMSSSDSDMEYYRSKIPYPIKKIGIKGYSWHVKIQNIKEILIKLGLSQSNSHTKFIPDCYLYNTKEVRLQLLKGLMDGDGCASKQSGYIYITMSKKLSSDLMSLCRSLGFNCKQQVQKNKAYRVVIYTDDTIVSLPRKIDNIRKYSPNKVGSKAKGYIYKTAISSIEYSHKEKCKCVTVDSEDGLYLIGDYVTTHNSKGVTATLPINNFANGLIREWLLKPVPTIIKEDGEDKEIQVSNLYFIRNRALLKELVLFNPDINVDRVRALGMLMLYREEKMILYQGNISSDREEKYRSSYLGNDPFFNNNYNNK